MPCCSGQRKADALDRLNGKFCLITGAGQGIGAACARFMARQGARVMASDIDGEGAARTAAEIGPAARAITLDVTRPAHWQRAVQQTVDQLGGFNVLVNNAGVCLTGSIEALSEDDWDTTMNVDLKSVFLGCKASLAAMAQHKPGAIVNISSISAMVASGNFAAYNAAKAGVHLLTKSVALHAARKGYDITCNSIHPAFVDTAMVDDVVKSGDRAGAIAKLARQVPLGRIATVEDVAHMAVYLASDEAAFVTGAEFKLDGGLSAM